MSALSAYLSGSGGDEKTTRAAQGEVEKAMKAGTATMDGLCVTLEPQLTSTEDVARAKGMRCLAWAAQVNALTEHQVGVLSEFVTARLDDYACADALADLCGVLMGAQKGPREGLMALVRGIGEKVRIPALPHEARHAYLQGFVSIFEQVEVVEGLGGDLALGVVQAMDGEKDPRNLLLAFHLVARLMDDDVRDWRRYAEDLFEVTACYFPVTFRRKSDDPDAVQPQQLRDALLACLSHPSLAQFSFPFLLDKLSDDAVVDEARGDTLAVINRLLQRDAEMCATQTGAHRPDARESPALDITGAPLIEGVTGDHMAALGAALRAGVLNARPGTAMADQCISSLGVACAAVSRGLVEDVKPDSLLGRLLAPVLDACAAQAADTMCAPRLRLDCGRVIAACCRGSETSCLRALTGGLQPLLERAALPRTESSLTVRRADVSLLTGMIEAINERLMRGGEVAPGMHPLRPYRDDVVDVLRGSLLNEPSAATRTTALSGLGALSIAQPLLLDDAQRALVVDATARALLDDDNGDVRRCGLSLMCAALSHPTSLAHGPTLARLTSTLETLFERMQQPVEENSASLRAFAVLAQIAGCGLSDVFDQVVVAVMDNLRAAVGDQAWTRFSVALECLRVACRRKCDAQRAVDTIVQPLLTLLEERAATATTLLPPTTMLRCVSMMDERLEEIALDGRVRMRDTMLKKAQLMAVDPSPAVRQMLVFCAAMVQLAPDDVDNSVTAVAQVVLSAGAENDVTRAATTMLATWINHSPGIDDAQTELIAQLCGACRQGNVAAASALLWCTKAGMMRGFAWADETILLIVNDLLCGDAPDLVRDVVAAGFGEVLFADTMIALAPSRSRFSRFYKQKYFTKVAQAKQGDERLLLAVCGALRHLPHAVVEQYAPMLTPLVSQAVQRGGESALEAVIALLATGKDGAPALIVATATHAQRLAKDLLTIATESTNPRAQKTALIALRQVMCDSVPFRHVFPIKTVVLDGLGALLNADKRSVRREAARTRNEVFVLGVEVPTD